jgi:hypothetical protein
MVYNEYGILNSYGHENLTLYHLYEKITSKSWSLFPKLSFWKRRRVDGVKYFGIYHCFTNKSTFIFFREWEIEIKVKRLDKRCMEK